MRMLLAAADGGQQGCSFVVSYSLLVFSVVCSALRTTYAVARASSGEIDDQSLPLYKKHQS